MAILPAGVAPRNLDAIIVGGKYHKPSLQEFLSTASALPHPEQEMEYLDRLGKLNGLRDRLLALIEKQQVDVLVYPLEKCLAVPIGAASQVDRNGILAALTGLPAVTVPIGFSKPAQHASLGIPMGMDILGRSFDEGLLVKIVYAFEQATKFRRPPVEDGWL